MKTVLFVIVCIGLARGDICGKATVSEQSTYTTKDRRLSFDTAFLTKFRLRCSSGSEEIPLYAEVGGKIYPVTKSPEGSVYQLSWVSEPANAGAGNYPARFFDEEGVNALRKAIRNEEDTSAVKALFTIDVTHGGNSRDLWITSEAVGLVIAGLIYYAVCQLRSEVIN